MNGLRLRDKGNTVLAVEHAVGLGPDADGGQVVFEGTSDDLATARSTLTGEHLATYVGASSDVKKKPES